tara:strand:+ start:271 stop:987 length:717 start_codon:yes stop_codon:yes gene_type:complete
MTTGLTYSQYVTEIATMAVVEPTDAAFLSILPQCITYAENRMYRELDFLFTSIANTSYSCTVGTRSIAVPSGTFVVPEQINVITPSSVSNPDLGTRVPLLPATKEFLDAVHGSGLSTGTPKYFCPFDDYTFLVGPYPDAAYTVEIVGTIRPDSLSVSNPTTFISLYLPDLMIMASMVYISGYQRNFGRANDDPQMAVTYESQYQSLLKGAMMEESRKKFEAAAWSSQGPSAAASPTRG